MILAGDVGGTKTNLAYFEVEAGRLNLVFEKSFSSQQFGSLQEVIRSMQQERPARITAAAFGIAGPIVNKRSTLTNLGWTVTEEDLKAELNVPDVGLLNDLEAMAYGTAQLHEDDCCLLQGGDARPQAAVAVIAAGTGLGEGGLVWDGRRYRAIPSEGGHSDFAPRNELEMDLLRYMLKRYERVSCERLVSGPGLYHIYEFLRERSGVVEPSWLREKIQAGDPSAAVSHAGVEGADPVCVQALEMFVALYGAEAGNLALKLLATGGIFVGGGIAPKILSKIQEGIFMNALTAKGRYVPLLQSIPVRVILNDRISLFGAAHFASVMRQE